MSSEIRQALSSLQGFGALSASIQEQFLPFISTRIIRAGETVFCQGEPSPYCFGVLSGEVIIQHVSKDKRFSPKVLGVVSPGGLFGESAIFEDSLRVAMASASKDGKLLTIRGPQLREWIQKNPAEGQPLLLTLLKESLGRLHSTSHELSVIYGVGRLMGSGKPFMEQLSATLEFLKGSLKGFDDFVFYERSAYWEEFTPVMSVPALSDLKAIALQSELVQKVITAADAPHFFEMQPFKTQLAALGMSWEERMSLVVLPLFDWDKKQDSLQGLLLIGTSIAASTLSSEMQLLLSSVSHPIAEAHSRHGRQEEASAQTRLEQSKKSFPR